MPKFLIERELAGAGKLRRDELQGISRKSCGVLRELGPEIQWIQSYVTDDKIYCIYIAPNAESCASTRSREAFRPIGSRRCSPSSTRRPPSRQPGGGLPRSHFVAAIRGKSTRASSLSASSRSMLAPCANTKRDGVTTTVTSVVG